MSSQIVSYQIKKHSLMLTLLASILSACTVGPNFVAPTSPNNKSYLPEQDTLLSSDQRILMGQQLSADWWTLFASDNLNQVIKRALQHNNQLQAAKESLAQANEYVLAANGGLMPQVSLAATAGRQKYGTALFGPANFTIPPFTYYEAGPTLNWDLDLAGGKRRKVEQQQAQANYQAQQLQAAYLSMTGNIVAQALANASAQAKIATMQQIIDEDGKTLKLVQLAFSEGARTKNDVLAAQNQLTADQAQLPALQQQLDSTQHALSLLAGAAPAEWTPPAFTLQQFALPHDIPVSLPSQLVKKRPDILAAEANLHAASAAIGVATANLYPNISISANLMQEALSPNQLFNAGNTAWSLASGLTAPLFNGGTLTAEKKAAEHAYQASLAQYKQTVLQSFTQVADQLKALQHDAETLQVEQQSVQTAEAALKLARQSYQAGSGNLLQVQDAERQLSRSSLALIDAQSQRLQDTTRLFVALGGSPLPN